jgi:hypothetical protein
MIASLTTAAELARVHVPRVAATARCARHAGQNTFRALRCRQRHLKPEPRAALPSAGTTSTPANTDSAAANSL